MASPEEEHGARQAAPGAGQRARPPTRRGGPKYVTLSHVRAHARTPGNEAADQLAKEVARDGTVSNDAMRALTIASTAHRRVRGESDQTSWQPPHQSATSTTTPSTSTHGDGGTGEGVRRWVGEKTCTGLYPAAGPEGSSWCRSRSRSGTGTVLNSKTTHAPQTTMHQVVAGGV